MFCNCLQVAVAILFSINIIHGQTDKKAKLDLSEAVIQCKSMKDGLVFISIFVEDLKVKKKILCYDVEKNIMVKKTRNGTFEPVIYQSELTCIKPLSPKVQYRVFGHFSLGEWPMCYFDGFGDHNLNKITKMYVVDGESASKYIDKDNEQVLPDMRDLSDLIDQDKSKNSFDGPLILTTNFTASLAKFNLSKCSSANVTVKDLGNHEDVCTANNNFIQATTPHCNDDDKNLAITDVVPVYMKVSLDYSKYKRHIFAKNLSSILTEINIRNMKGNVICKKSSVFPNNYEINAMMPCTEAFSNYAYLVESTIKNKSETIMWILSAFSDDNKKWSLTDTEAYNSKFEKLTPLSYTASTKLIIITSVLLSLMLGLFIFLMVLCRKLMRANPYQQYKWLFFDYLRFHCIIVDSISVIDNYKTSLCKLALKNNMSQSSKLGAELRQHLNADDSEEDHGDEPTLPMANILELVWKAIPLKSHVTNEALSIIRDCADEFINVLSSEAFKICRINRKNRMSGLDIIRAMKKLGFTNYADSMLPYLRVFRRAVKTDNLRYFCKFNDYDKTLFQINWIENCDNKGKSNGIMQKEPGFIVPEESNND
ncbi:hypothetical protein GJ496_007585 [Pomphorhynchus laevis]|nr:hypothetical protein GJ496_007585 [Pomphorhynchus laevis]